MTEPPQEALFDLGAEISVQFEGTYRAEDPPRPDRHRVAFLAGMLSRWTFGDKPTLEQRQRAEAAARVALGVARGEIVDGRGDDND